MDLVVDLATVLEDVGVVEDGRAPRKRQLRATDDDGRARVLRRAAGPDPVVSAQPGKEIRVLTRREIPCQHLVEVVMAVDQSWQDNLPGQVEHRIGGLRELVRGADLLDHAVAGEQPRIPQLAPLAIHRHEDVRIFRQQGRHGFASHPFRGMAIVC